MTIHKLRKFKFYSAGSSHMPKRIVTCTRNKKNAGDSQAV